MTEGINKTKILFIIFFLVIIAGTIVYWSLVSSTSSFLQSQNIKENDVLTDISLEAPMKLADNISTESKSVNAGKQQTQTLVGTWVKQRINYIESLYPEDIELHLIVTFCDDGRFIWDSKQYKDDGVIIDESLTGTYRIEKGFIIAYEFDKPSQSAQEKLQKFFAFWPNKLLGRQTFKIRDDILVLGHDSEKLWFHLKRNSNIEPVAKEDTGN